MKAIMTLCVGIALLGMAGPGLAGELDLDLGPDAVPFEAGDELAPSEYREEASVYHAQLLGMQRRSERHDVGVGASWSHYDTNHGEGGGLGVGGYGYVYLPNLPEVSLGGYGYYTPEAMGSRDLNDGYEVGVRARYAFAPNLDGYLGLRQLGADFDDDEGRRTLDRGAQLGVRLRF